MTPQSLLPRSDLAAWATASWCWSCNVWFSPPQHECPKCGRPGA